MRCEQRRHPPGYTSGGGAATRRALHCCGRQPRTGSGRGKTTLQDTLGASTQLPIKTWLNSAWSHT